MSKILRACLMAFLFAFLLLQPAGAAPMKICIFNFAAAELDSASLGTSVTHNLNEYFRSIPNFQVMDRKELEQFLSLNDLRQNENLDNIAVIGSRLGLDIVITGSVGRSGRVTTIAAKAVQISRKRVIINTQAQAIGSGILAETKAIGDNLSRAIMTCDTGLKEEPESALGPPAKIEARPGSMSVHLQWDCPPLKASGFKIYRAVSEKGPFTGIANVKGYEFTDQGLEKKKTYFYKIRAYNDRGLQSSFSRVVRCETEAVPNPPIIIKTEPRIKSVLLTFAPNPVRSEDPLKITGFRLYRSGSEHGIYKEAARVSAGGLAATDEQSGNPLQHADKGLKDGESCFYRLTSVNEKGLESDYSRPVQGEALPAISGLEIKGDMIREIHLGWNKMNTPNIAGYNIYRCALENGKYDKIKSIATGPEGGKMLFVDKAGLTDLTRYYYRVTAYDQQGAETSDGTTVSAVTRGKPPVPAGLQASSGGVKLVELKWEPSKEEEVCGYKIYRSTERTGSFALARKLEGRAKSSFTDEGKGSEYEFSFGSFGRKLEDGRTYYYCITSFNKVDVESSISQVASATTKARPTVPQGLRLQSRDGKPGITWSANPEKDIDMYIVFEKTEAGLKKITSTRETAYVEKSLPAGKSKVLAVSAIDKDGLESGPSAEFILK